MAGQFIVVQNQSVQLFEILQEMEIPGCLLRLNITKMSKYSLKVNFCCNNTGIVYKHLQHQIRGQNGATAHLESNRRYIMLKKNNYIIHSNNWNCKLELVLPLRHLKIFNNVTGQTMTMRTISIEKASQRGEICSYIRDTVVELTLVFITVSLWLCTHVYTCKLWTFHGTTLLNRMSTTTKMVYP